MSSEPLHSEFADETTMQELLKDFCAGMTDTYDRLRQGMDAGDVESVCRIGHQLKGAGGGYGYPQLTQAGAELEQAARGEKAIPDEIRTCAEALIDLCQRAQAGFRLK